MSHNVVNESNDEFSPGDLVALNSDCCNGIWVYLDDTSLAKSGQFYNNQFALVISTISTHTTGTQDKEVYVLTSANVFGWIARNRIEKL